MESTVFDIHLSCVHGMDCTILAAECLSSQLWNQRQSEHFVPVEQSRFFSDIADITNKPNDYTSALVIDQFFVHSLKKYKIKMSFYNGFVLGMGRVTRGPVENSKPRDWSLTPGPRGIWKKNNENINHFHHSLTHKLKPNFNE